MIYLIVGENMYQRAAELHKIVAVSGLTLEKYDGAELTEAQLADCIAGATLFSDERLVAITDLSSNKSAWDSLGSWTERVSPDTTLVLLEAKPDKRTKTYKALVKASTVITADHWTDRQIDMAVTWTVRRAKELGFGLAQPQARQIVNRTLQAGDRPGAFIINQQLLDNALRALSLLDDVTDEAVATVLPESTADNVFELLETALDGNAARTNALLGNLHASADPYMVFGLITSQWSQLAALKLSGEGPDALAGAIGSSPYVLKKLHKYAIRLSHTEVKELTVLLASLDVRLKTTGMEPWIAVDRFIGALSQ